LKEYDLDETDQNIIDHLRQKNLTNSALAEKLGLSEGAVRQRIKKLKDTGILKIRAQINPDSLARQQLATIAITLSESKTLDTKASEISKLNNVLSVSITSGQYDLIVEILVNSNKGLVKFLTETLASVNGITKTESFLMLKSYNKYV